jgi:indolepyruvate ferredoxin oxidoreductase alpha subunit
VPLERLLAGCGVDFLEIHDPYDMRGLIQLLKRAYDYALSPDGGVAVIISRHPCLIALGGRGVDERTDVFVSERCKGCRHCVEAFECPALTWDPDKKRVSVEPTLCAGCGVCLEVCPRRAIQKTRATGKGP